VNWSATSLQMPAFPKGVWTNRLTSFFVNMAQEEIGESVIAMEWQLPHWLILAGTLLVIASLIGMAISRKRRAKVQDDPTTEQRSGPFPKLPPLPDLLDSRPRKNRR
jgi:hypothetical protein